MPEPLKVLVTGHRDFSDTELFDYQMAPIYEQGITHVIHGGASGADALADAWARRHGIQPVRCDALWTSFGKYAGPRRNRAMLALNPDLVVAFPLADSKGTFDMMDIAREAGIAVINATTFERGDA